MKLFILGAGGHARETFFHIKDIDPKVEILFIDDVSDTLELSLAGKKIPVIKDWNQVAELSETGFKLFTIGIGNPIHKESFVEKAKKAGLIPHKTWIHPSAVVQDANIGKGGLVAPGVVITCNVSIGDFVVLNYNSTVGHDSIIADYVTCNPGSNISGNVNISKGTLIGAGAVIREKISIAENVVVGAQSCVVKDIKQSGVTVVGIPAKTLN